MKDDEVSWERVVYEARKKPDDPIAKVFLETEEKLVALEQELAALREENEQLRKGTPIGPIVGAEVIREQAQQLALCEMHCQEQAQRLDALREQWNDPVACHNRYFELVNKEDVDWEGE